MLHVEMIVLSNHKPRTRALVSKISLFSHFDMADNRVKRKAWMHCKDAKIPRTTAWRSKAAGKRNVRKSLMSDSLVKMSIVAEESVRSSSSVSDELTLMFANETGFQSDRSSTVSPTSTTEIDNFEDEVDDFTSFFMDSVAYSGEKSSSESDTERSDSSSDSEFDSEKGETSGIIHESKMSNEDLVDDNIPLYKGARVSRLRAFVLVMLFTLRHQLSGRALIDLLKVLHALLPDGHRFVASAFLLKKYFADLFGEPSPKKHSYCGNCLGRIRNPQTECLKEKCQKSKKKIEHFLELDLHMRLCQLYRGK